MVFNYVTRRIIPQLVCNVKPYLSIPTREFAVKRDEFINENNNQEVQVEQWNDGLYILSLNRQKVKNALSYSIVNELEDILKQLYVNRQIKCLIVRSLVNGVFCAGADLKERLAMDNHDVGSFVERLRNLAKGLDELPFPTIAAIDGAAFGGGLELALACDLRVASLKAKLGLVETKLAILPGAGGTQRLPRLIGLSKAKDLIFTGRKLDGQEAYRIGLVDYLAENESPDAAFNRSVEVAKDICSSGPLGVRWAKFAISKGIEVDINSGMAFEKAAYAQVTWTKDREEGMKSFIEKRNPIYKGE